MSEADLERRLEDIERRLSRLEGYRPDNPSPPFPSLPHVQGVERCPQCGMIFEGVMSYSCSNISCPMMVVAT